MTDREALEELLRRFGIEPTVSEYDANVIHLERNISKNVDGYAGFFAEFEFNEDGSFKTFGVWE